MDKILLLFFLLICISSGYVYNIEELSYRSYKHRFRYCSCNNVNNTVNNTSQDNITTLSPNLEYSFENLTLVKFNVTNCTSLNFDTNYDNVYRYSFDMSNWTDVRGYNTFCPKLGYIYFSISGKFTLYTSDPIVQSVISYILAPLDLFEYNYTGYSNLGLYLTSNCTLSVTVDVSIIYNNITYDNLNYFGFNRNDTSSNLYYKTKNNDNVTFCYSELKFGTGVESYISNYTSPFYFYNNMLIHSYTHIISNQSNIILDGYDSTVPSTLSINEVNSTEEYLVYLKIVDYLYIEDYSKLDLYYVEIINGNQNELEKYLYPFDEMLFVGQRDKVVNITSDMFLLKNLIISSTDGTKLILWSQYPYDDIYFINSTSFSIKNDFFTKYYYSPQLLNITDYNLNSNLTVVNIINSTIIINGIHLKSFYIKDSSVVINENISILELITEDNLLLIIPNISSDLNGSLITVSGCVNLSGNLTIDYQDTINQGSILELFQYSCINNKFNNIIIKHNDSEIDHCEIYSQNQLQILFGECQALNEEKGPTDGVNYKLILMVIIPIVVVVILVVIVTILFKVPQLRKKLFPHEARITWKATDNEGYIFPSNKT